MTQQKTNLVLIHGWGMNNAVWETLPASISDRYHLHPIELPGHGDSPETPEGGDLQAWADAVLAQAPEQAIWLGWSLGALVALQAALQTRRPGRPLGPGQQAPMLSGGHPTRPATSQKITAGRTQPARISALILLTANPRFVQATDWRAAMDTAVFDGFHHALIDDPRGTLERFLSLQVRGTQDARETLRQLRASIAKRPLPQREALLTGLDLLREEDLRPRLADIQQPTLWLFGERDTLVPAAVAERIALLMPSAHCEVIPGAAHAPLLSHPEAVRDEMTDFLNRCAQ
ncbi:MAG: alpha/beta fold hydrolase [Halieaceae bacterium]|jgi:pimeloyl-[acyl-carrier protein] methyl ester esterase|nr:alpha/beta fold hydrolase [Halieaceae bacterium]